MRSRCMSGKFPADITAYFATLPLPMPTMLTVTAQRPLDLKRQLLVRVSLFALIVLLLGSSVTLLETRYRVRADIQRTGDVIRQLISAEINRNSQPYDRSLRDINVDLGLLEPIGNLLGFCISMTDIYAHVVEQRCFNNRTNPPQSLTALMRVVIGSDAAYHAGIGQYPGIAVGQLAVTPDYASEALQLTTKLGQLLALSILILLLSFFVYRPVRNALAPSQAILETLDRMDRGDLRARMPAFALIELSRISSGFNRLADRLQNTIRNQQRLAHRLLSVREEERQHLARELHDEFGQYLASLNAEAAFARELADEQLPDLRPCADAIARTSSHMMETLQQILHRLRPVGLEEFGLHSSLQQLLAGWNQRCREQTVFTLDVSGDADGMPDDINVNIYRIVQESLTNAIRHGMASAVEVRLQRHDNHLLLTINDNGRQAASRAPTPAMKKSGGFGLLGMEERVLALGGELSFHQNAGSGSSVKVRLPLPAGEEDQT